MALATFPSVSPQFNGTSGDTNFRVLKAGFGDGYVQRAADGLNSMGKTYNLSFGPLTSTENTQVKAFLDARKGVEAFYWTIPGEASPRKWTCERYTERKDDVGAWAIDATFELVFDVET